MSAALTVSPHENWMTCRLLASPVDRCSQRALEVLWRTHSLLTLPVMALLLGCLAMVFEEKVQMMLLTIYSGA
jgi:hypothetical protein